jgi:hypothetical protein
MLVTWGFLHGLVTTSPRVSFQDFLVNPSCPICNAHFFYGIDNLTPLDNHQTKLFFFLEDVCVCVCVCRSSLSVTRFEDPRLY